MGRSIATKLVVRDIPLNKLVPSTTNVRQTGRGDGIEDLAASILAHGVLQNLTVRVERDDANRETGKYEVIAGGRRLAALNLLAQRKKIGKATPVSCNVREDASAKELSLVENALRLNLHPADQFEAFRALHEDEGMGLEQIAARFGVSVRTVRERLKLAGVSPKLVARYREGELSLDQIMAFAVIDDPKRQEEAWENLAYDASPQFIRHSLLRGHVPAEDKRARFVGIDAYEAAGGAMLRDLFAEDEGGYLTDTALLDRLARSKLENVAQVVEREGWKWVDVAVDFPYANGMRRIYPHDVDLSEEDARRLEQVEEELDRLGAEREASDSPDEDLDAKIAALNAEYSAIDARGRAFSFEELARAGAIVSIDFDGNVAIARGLVRPEDESAMPSDHANGSGNSGETESSDRFAPHGLSDRLLADLSAHWTMAMRDRLGSCPDTAQATLVHGLALHLFFNGEDAESCLRFQANSTNLEVHAAGIGESVAGRSVAARHEHWAEQLAKESPDLWPYVLQLSTSDRNALLAHCVSLLVNAVQTLGERRSPAAEALASVLDLKMRVYWRPTAANYFERVPKALSLNAVREGVTAEASERLRSLKKAELAQAAERLLAETDWLPEQFRLPSSVAESEPVAGSG